VRDAWDRVTGHTSVSSREDAAERRGDVRP
jgi:hypothetical protein